jgi:hypothetical protein
VESCHRELCGNGLDDDGDGKKDCLDDDCAADPLCVTDPILEHCANGLDDDGDGDTDCDDNDCLTNPHCVEVFCSDGVSNDDDGLVDCEDPDCQGGPACQPNTTCQEARPIQCGAVLLDTTRGRPNSFSEYPCRQGGPYLGGERFYVFTNGTAGTQNLYVSLQAFTPSTAFIAVGLTGTASGCNAAVCLTSNTTGDFTSTFPLPTGHTAYLVVDSVEAAGGLFKLTVHCTDTDVEICGNGEDDDGDYDVDCMDPDCLGYFGCNYWISGGVRCETDDPSLTCAPGERCLPLLVGGTMTSAGICTKACGNPGSPPTVCTHPTYTHGECVPFSGQVDHCIMRCGTLYGTTGLCPPSTLCTDPANGSTGNVYDGICAPYT